MGIYKRGMRGGGPYNRDFTVGSDCLLVFLINHTFHLSDCRAAPRGKTKEDCKIVRLQDCCSNNSPFILLGGERHCPGLNSDIS